MREIIEGPFWSTKPKKKEKKMWSKTSIVSFYTEAEAMHFCNRNPKMNLMVEKELDGRFHVYNMD